MILLFLLLTLNMKLPAGNDIVDFSNKKFEIHSFTNSN